MVQGLLGANPQRFLWVGLGVLIGLSGAVGAYGFVRLVRPSAELSVSVCSRWPVTAGSLDGHDVQTVLIQPTNVGFEQRPYGYWSEPSGSPWESWRLPFFELGRDGCF
jgi:hypothetical protein